MRALQPGLLLTKPPGWLRTLSADGTAPTRTFTSVALFFDLDTSRTLTNADHFTTTSATRVAGWLALGTPNRSGFMQNYWSALSYGKLQLSVVANTDATGTPVIPAISPKDDNANAWDDIAQQIIQQTPRRIWQLAGSITDGNVRVIPSVVVVQNYDTQAEASAALGAAHAKGYTGAYQTRVTR